MKVGNIATRLVRKYGITEAQRRVRERALRSVDAGRVSLAPSKMDRYILWSFVGNAIFRIAVGFPDA